MSNKVDITISLDREIKEKAENMFNDFGMDLSTAFNIFIRQSLRQGEIFFEIHDPFYSEANQAELSRRIADIESGKAKLIERELLDDA